MKKITNECEKQAAEFLAKANAEINIEFQGCAINTDWNEKTLRNLYGVTIKTPHGSMAFNFWDSIYNTEIMQMTPQQYAAKRLKKNFNSLAYREQTIIINKLNAEKEKAKPSIYDILACLQKYEAGTFEEFCAEFGYDEDSRKAERIYIAVVREYTQLTRIFTDEQIEELREIN